MKIVGIDYSKDSPGIVWFDLDKKFEIVSKNYLGFTDVKKDATKNILYYNKKKDFPNEFEQYIWMRDNVYNTITNNCKPDYVAFEGYAYKAKGRVFNIAEATGVLKLKIYDNKIPMRIYDPNSIKMFSTANGNAGKDLMFETYTKLPESEKFSEIFTEKKHNDIIDAYFICKILQTELKLRFGYTSLKDLKEHEIRIMNRCTKANPVNVLDVDFIEKKE